MLTKKFNNEFLGLIEKMDNKTRDNYVFLIKNHRKKYGEILIEFIQMEKYNNKLIDINQFSAIAYFIRTNF